MIELKGLNVGYKGKEILKDIRFFIPPGKMSVLLGRNGAGKSTLIRTIAGIHENYNGEILIDGVPVNSMSRRQRAKKLSVVLTQYPQMPLTVDEIIASGRIPFTNSLFRLNDEDRRIISETVAWLRLEPYSGRMFSSLSDGEKQRVMIARALVQQTPVLLLDEPASHLDLPAMAEILVWLKRLASGGKTVLFSTHRFDFIFDLADYLILLDRGKAYAGTTEEILQLGRFQEVFRGEFLIFDEENRIFKLKSG